MLRSLFRRLPLVIALMLLLAALSGCVNQTNNYGSSRAGFPGTSLEKGDMPSIFALRDAQSSIDRGMLVGNDPTGKHPGFDWDKAPTLEKINIMDNRREKAANNYTDRSVGGAAILGLIALAVLALLCLIGWWILRNRIARVQRNAHNGNSGNGNHNNSNGGNNGNGGGNGSQHCGGYQPQQQCNHQHHHTPTCSHQHRTLTTQGGTTSMPDDHTHNGVRTLLGGFQSTLDGFGKRLKYVEDSHKVGMQQVEADREDNLNRWQKNAEQHAGHDKRFGEQRLVNASQRKINDQLIDGQEKLNHQVGQIAATAEKITNLFGQATRG